MDISLSANESNDSVFETSENSVGVAVTGYLFEE